MTALTEQLGLAGAEPAELTGIRIGYLRMATGGQKLDRRKPVAELVALP